MSTSSQRRDVRRPTPRRRTLSTQSQPNSDFVDFLHRLLDILFTPRITYPLRLIRDVITSPLTISVVVKTALLALLLLASAVFSFLAVGAFWWSWGTGGSVETEGWLVYGSRTHRTPHAVLPINLDRFQEDLPYDVQVELELVRPHSDAPETGNFMVSVELRSVRNPEHIVIAAAQPIKERRRKGSLIPPARGNEVVLMTKELLEGVVVRPGRGDGGVGAVFVSIGREDTHDNAGYHREVRTTGWVVVRFVPHPTGVRWLLTSNPLPPLLILPPLSLVLTISSALLGFLVISCCSRRGYQQRARAIAEKEKRDEDKDKKKMRGEVEGKLDFEAGDRAEPFRGGAQWQKFASATASRPSHLRNRTTSRGSVEVSLVNALAASAVWNGGGNDELSECGL
ncbi:hypothetical protein A1Q2_05793 [Trichosporon asahii var. asahii CBS 8904]|uniref:Adipose-regulatory protein n=1 Tax=Trichosporon asahii var. asahii (strain CBS 8904) TaxID=1220162 RepID=K1VKY6_TRIAC|nr:hypothetical protein A1Q2_05793 [Trichosporon asahii var. asahii CBS 8904]